MGWTRTQQGVAICGSRLPSAWAAECPRKPARRVVLRALPQIAAAALSVGPHLVIRHPDLQLFWWRHLGGQEEVRAMRHTRTALISYHIRHQSWYILIYTGEGQVLVVL